MWHGVFPPYMGELARKFMESRHSPLAILFSDTLTAKLCAFDLWLISSYSESGRIESVSELVCNLINHSIAEEDAITLFYVLFVLFVNIDTFRTHYIYFGTDERHSWQLGRKPQFMFDQLLHSDIFPQEHPMRQLLTKLNVICEENETMFEEGNTVLWDLVLSSLITKLTAYMLMHVHSL